MAAELDIEVSNISSTSVTTSSEIEETTSSDDNDPSICSLCNATNRATTDIADCKELKSIKDYIESSSHVVRNVRYACQTCLYKLYTIIDQNRLKAFREERERRLAAVAALIKSTGASLPSSPKILAAVARLSSSSLSNTQLTSTSPVPVPQKTEESYHVDAKTASYEREKLPTYTESPQRQEDFIPTLPKSQHIEMPELTSVKPQEPSHGNEAESVVSSSPSHLDILYERSESALITESGGAMDQYKNPPLQCRFCPKMFVLIKPYQKHMRSHRSSHTSSIRSRIPSANLIFACTDCSATFESSAKLKTHCRIHMKRYYCTYCHKESLSSFDHDFHEAECRGEQMAKNENMEIRRITRSIARSTRSVVSDKTTKNSMTATRAKNNTAPKSFQSGRSFATKSSAKNYHNKDEEDDDDDDGATSVACTDYTGFNSYVEKWVAGTCRSENGYKSILRKTSQFTDEEPVVVSQKEYDIIMLERLIVQSDLNVYSCCFSNCDYVTNTLREMCLHEILMHRSKTFYYCRKCKGVFTSKLFLDYHLYMQNYAEYRCNKCTMRFSYEYQLQYHLLMHQQNEEFLCLYCANSFISSHELRIHCLETGHDPKKRKKTINIDHSMTIVNETEPEPPPPKKTYKCTVNIMDLPKMQSIRPMHIIWPKGRNIFLGDIDFEYQPGRNCVRTK